MSTRLQQTLAAFDRANAKDPNKELDEGGELVPKELLYARRMSETLVRFCPEASEHLQLAARAQHIERWTSPRSDYPEGRSGYKKWRSQLSLYHARRAGDIMREQGYAEEDIERVRFLIQKRQLKRDDQTQTLEDVICLVFLQHYLDAFAGKHEQTKVIDILQKTWRKMSDAGQQAALKLPYSPEMKALLERCLTS